jgi:hypothetical protein
MLKRNFIVVFCGIALLGCGVSSQQGATRTLTGLTTQQVLIAAQHVLAEEGIDTEEINVENARLISSWQEKNNRQLQYEIAIVPKSEAEGEADETSSDVETLVVSVSVNSREKIVGGWSEPVVSSSSYTSSMLDDIVSMSILRYNPAATPMLSKAKCSSTEECPTGTHCGSGHCVSECQIAGDCEYGTNCDDRGRCVPNAETCEQQPEPPSDNNEDEGNNKKRRRSSHDE